MLNTILFEPLVLPNGTTLPNRICKAAMEEDMADRGQVPGAALCELYKRWATGGVGLLISGNVMIDRHAVSGPGAVVLERDTALEPFQRWAEAGKCGGSQFWLQLNHPGRALQADMGGRVWAPSAIPLNLGKHSKMFGRPTAMTSENIAEVIARFADSARRAEQAGFDGVELHGAHGYLLSQFLSPLANRRGDSWGGSLENRARLLLDVVRAIRAVVKPRFGLGVKLNSADFQRGGFDTEDSQQVVRWLNELAVDLIEVSGGTYESQAMQGRPADQRTLEREAYFLEFARDIANVATFPVMTTGGIRRPEVAARVLATGVSVVGMATALAFVPDLIERWRRGDSPTVALRTAAWRDKSLVSAATIAQTVRQLHRIGRGEAPHINPSPLWSLLTDRLRRKLLLRRFRRWTFSQRVGRTSERKSMLTL